jgi:hypothetical protein
MSHIFQVKNMHQSPWYTTVSDYLEQCVQTQIIILFVQGSTMTKLMMMGPY